MSSPEAIDPPARVGHPKGLYVLFGAEMWERFSYYGMRALLVLYLTKHLQMQRPDALKIYATYTGLVYLTPLLGGFLADRFLGQRKAILIGGIVMAMGHFAMAFEPLLYQALALLIIGNGFFKPNISTLVGELYPQEDPRRDGAYTIFYMGINLGAFFSPLVCGTLGETVGWHYGFGAAGIGMVFGLISFVAFQRLLVGGFPPRRQGAGPRHLEPIDWVHVALISLTCLALAFGFVGAWPHIRSLWAPTRAVSRFTPQAPGLAIFGYQAMLVLGAIGLVHLALGRMAPDDKERDRDETDPPPRTPFTVEDMQRIAVIIIITVFAVIFWMGFEQGGGTLNLFADEKTDRRFFDYNFPASWFQAVNPLLIFVLAPLMSMMWTRLDQSRFRLPSIAKLGLGLILVGLGFVVMYGAEQRATTVGKVAPFWLASVYLLHTIGELCLSPIGLSLVNKLAPARVASLMMAVWFLSSAAANYLAGTLEQILQGYHVNLWAFLIVTPIGSGLLLLALTPLLNKLTHGRG